MTEYRWHHSGTGVIRVSDGAVLMPGDTAMWHEYMAWMYAGNEPLPAIQPPIYKPPLSKVTIINRLSDSELQALQDARSVQPLRQQMLWDNAQSVDTDNADLRAFFSAVLGEQRAEEVLAIGVT